MTVFAVNMMKDDISKAAAYGDIKFINLKYVYGDELEQATNGEQYMPRSSWEKLADCVHFQFDHNKDFLLIAGDHLQLVAISALLGKQFPYFKVLRWDRQAAGYIPVTIIT